MSYARWSNHDWYAFYDVKSGDTRDTQVLSIWHVKDQDCMPSYTYKQLKDDREAVWSDIASRITTTERDVFDRCIDRFIEDVEEDYGAAQAGGQAGQKEEA